MSIYAELERREAEKCPVRVAVVGTGFFGGGLVRQLYRTPGLVPAVVANRTLERAQAALVAAGADPREIVVCTGPEEADAAIARGQFVVTNSLLLPAHVASINVVMEATGDVLVGTAVAVEAIHQGKHIVAANPETQATVGAVLQQMAEMAGVVYSDVDGDQPGLLKQLYDYVLTLGLTPVVAGNCKGVLKRYATPATQEAFARAHGLKPWIAAAAADGTKLNIEMAVVANATGMRPAVTGMVGPETTLASVLADFEQRGLLAAGPIVEYTLGIPNGVFVIGHSADPAVQREFRYLKMGDGPYYLLYRPQVLCHYEAPLSAAEAALHQCATIAPRGQPVAEVVAYAKRDLPAGQRLDGIGGFDCYGLIMAAEEAQRADLLPVGLASFARLTRPIPQDAPIPHDAVTFEEDNLVLALRRRQSRLVTTANLGAA